MCSKAALEGCPSFLHRADHHGQLCSAGGSPAGTPPAQRPALQLRSSWRFFRHHRAGIPDHGRHPLLTNALRTLVTDDRRAYNVSGEKRMEDHDVQKAEIDPTSIAIVPLV
jgi:hypothetical protein